ncbi:hypothetical protein N5D77_26280 [Comamonas thiooxydans]|uniref:Uncharacterized protein n=1 Tax=Comamonas thiooxydans TaxID=363952 RepID=A0AA42Q5D8_9BURK|nr:hypothetical protein [Comamonas thiooxydans]MDH1337550.1 hypothetical protein [Comamonas thiooxydans]MDH1743551.1 hypothetical protein [Comamonas thiooxydans]MDH1790062.1 hypothetical protein [Comamonas thiooxydans]
MRRTNIRRRSFGSAHSVAKLSQTAGDLGKPRADAQDVLEADALGLARGDEVEPSVSQSASRT